MRVRVVWGLRDTMANLLSHQPVEHLASFRAIPQLEVIRPADAFETAEAYRYFFEKKNTLPAAWC